MYRTTYQTINNLTSKINKLGSRIEEQEQYSRRTSLRFNNVKAPTNERGEIGLFISAHTTSDNFNTVSPSDGDVDTVWLDITVSDSDGEEDKVFVLATFSDCFIEGDKIVR
jgi:hypothetical protein